MLILVTCPSLKVSPLPISNCIETFEYFSARQDYVQEVNQQTVVAVWVHILGGDTHPSLLVHLGKVVMYYIEYVLRFSDYRLLSYIQC